MAQMPTAEKLHAACDECRTRKLKCSRESPACSRCEREKINCVYSPQKPMGRPRKRRRDGSDSADATENQGENTTPPDSFIVPSFPDIGIADATDLNEFSDFTDFQTSSALGPSIQDDTVFGNEFGQEDTADISFSIGTIDPSLWNITPLDAASEPQPQLETAPISPQPDTGPCTCLAIMYLSLTDLQTMTNFAFPSVIPLLRKSMTTASTMIHCPKCPKENFNAISNVQALTSLLSALAERFHKVIREIDAEATRLEQCGGKKPFRVGDNSRENMHLHTGRLDCPMGFNIELVPSDWRKFAKQALRTEVIGGGSNQTPLVSLLDEMENRQTKWHADGSMHTLERAKLFGKQKACKEAMCLHMIHQIRRMVDAMDWD